MGRGRFSQVRPSSNDRAISVCENRAGSPQGSTSPNEVKKEASTVPFGNPGRGEGKDSRNFEQPEPKGAGEQTRAEPRTAAQWMAGVLPSARYARAHRYRGTRPLEPCTSPAGG